MHILHQIVREKEAEVARNKKNVPAGGFEQSPYFDREVFSLKAAIRDKTKWGIIAEFKPKSPSKGVINPHASVEATTKSYRRAGASALSVLTDTTFFGGDNKLLTVARENNECPVLRKDFMIDEFQVLEAKSIGADAILLIAAILTSKQIKELATMAKSLGMETLLEVQSREELESTILDQSIGESIDVVGINNRNLDTFEVNIENSEILASLVPSEYVKIAESGISHPETILKLREKGFEGFLIGEYFMKQSDPGEACAKFIASLSQEKEKI